MAERINEPFVDDQAVALQDRYGEVEVGADVVEVPADEFDEYVANARGGYVGGAHACVTRTSDQAGYPSESYAGPDVEREQALLILPRGSEAWGLPGGGVEDGESFERAVRREVLEETGVGCEVTGLWALVRRTWRSSDPDDHRETVTLHAFFDAEYVGGSITVQPGEVDGAAWFAERPGSLMEQTERRADSFF